MPIKAHQASDNFCMVGIVSTKNIKMTNVRAAMAFNSSFRSLIGC